MSNGHFETEAFSLSNVEWSLDSSPSIAIGNSYLELDDLIDIDELDLSIESASVSIDYSDLDIPDVMEWVQEEQPHVWAAWMQDARNAAREEHNAALATAIADIFGPTLLVVPPAENPLQHRIEELEARDADSNRAAHAAEKRYATLSKVAEERRERIEDLAVREMDLQSLREASEARLEVKLRAALNDATAAPIRADLADAHVEELKAAATRSVLIS